MKFVFTLVSLAISLMISAQTPELQLLKQGIHPSELERELQNPERSEGMSNFGAPDMINIKMMAVDEFRVLKDGTVQATVSHQVFQGFNWDGLQRVPGSDYAIIPDSVLFTALGIEKKRHWHAGIHILKNHSFINPSNTCEDITNRLYENRGLWMALNNTVFVGFECDLPKDRNKKNAIPILLPDPPSSPILLLVWILGLALILFLILNIRSSKTPLYAG